MMSITDRSTCVNTSEQLIYDGDRDWFRRNPNSYRRIRRPKPGETLIAQFVCVRQLPNGVLLRVALGGAQ